ncbi:biopolymer transport protein ExbD/biopolymer transport protein TolR [Verrucomicrobium sp. GAS474]|uniref:ExbD/TolR family protein n=1 Tax=Verrucomicrobium sp. GAS474 TaxID=1882831 RepID=UPI00087A68C0|nr:biopolymer transporter ExbD [Verrucomicrobium sp. GAS474]SDT93506.1 biopolymer transport protein ExbD/biopolymer transport protein TolR [Verrucomicrobium sp. GAS474]
MALKRYTQSNSHSTMAELNVTPMLDLAFTLLIIFIITTPLMEGNIEINLPTATPTKATDEKPDVKTVEVDKKGVIHFGGKIVTVDALRRDLEKLHQADPKVAVIIRADRDLRYQTLVDVFDALQRANITRLGLTHLDEASPRH